MGQGIYLCKLCDRAGQNQELRYAVSGADVVGIVAVVIQFNADAAGIACSNKPLSCHYRVLEVHAGAVHCDSTITGRQDYMHTSVEDLRAASGYVARLFCIQVIARIAYVGFGGEDCALVKIHRDVHHGGGLFKCLVVKAKELAQGVQLLCCWEAFAAI